jgi:uncharacterized repeat protein (TIGR03803 family)
MDQAGNLYVGDGSGNVLELSLSGGVWTERVIYSGASSYAGLTMDASGNIFGVTLKSVFELSSNRHGDWISHRVHTFAGAPKDGSSAEGAPVLDQAGNLYGMTANGGTENFGTVYQLSLGENGKWTETILHSFEGGQADGSQPWGTIAFDAAGNIYGTTEIGGKYGDGTVFELVAPVCVGSYQEKVLWSFDRTDGSQPYVGLILDSVGSLYGTTSSGGSNGYGVVFEVTP